MQQFDLQQIGPYRIIHLIGRGGMGAVYLAEDPRIKRQVAIKVMQIEISSPNDTSADKRADKKAARLQREATAIARLDHPGIVRLLSYDELNTQGGRYPYLVMEYYGEGSFAEWLRQHPDLPLHDAAYFIGQAANALQYAHENGVIHQDIKPANFLIRTRKDHPNLPNLLLTDFGVARLTDASSGTVPTAPMGTYTYMAPEQFDSNTRPLPATDQYSLAVMAYQLVTGRPPFQGPLPAVMKQHLWDQPQPPGIFNPRLPREVDNVILRALAKRPEDRYSSITEFARAFQQALQSQRGNDIREIIRINAAEAQTGTSHILTLPGGRQVTVSVPVGAQNGQVISLAGLGEPSRSGGPAGNLLVTIDITSPAGPTAPPPPLQPQPPPSVQVVTPPLQEMRFSTSSSYPVRTEPITRASDGKVNIWRIGKRQLVAAIIGIVIYGFLNYLLDLLSISASNSSNSPFVSPIIGGAAYSPTLVGILFGLTLAIIFFFGAVFGPWVGLVTALVGGLLGDLLSGYLSTYHVPWYVYVGVTMLGFFPGLALLKTQGHYHTTGAITIAVVISAIGMVIFNIFVAISDTINFHAQLSYLFTDLIYYILSNVFGLILLPFLLFIYNAIVTRRKPTSTTP